MEKQALLNTYVNNVDMSETICAIEEMIASKNKSYIVAINVDVVMKIENDSYLKKIVDDADMVLVDGKPLVWISKLHKRPVKAKISGSDLVPELCKVAQKKKYTIFIIGGKDGIAEKAKANLEKKLPDIEIVGVYAPPFGFEKNQDELDRINAMISDVHPDLLIACFGCPKQEKWIYENIDKLEKKNADFVIVDAPTLIENDLHKDMDYVILVWVDKNTQIQRVKSRDTLSKDEAINRINAQMPLDRKKDFSNIVIENNDTLAKTKEQVDLLIEFLKSI